MFTSGILACYSVTVHCCEPAGFGQTTAGPMHGFPGAGGSCINCYRMSMCTGMSKHAYGVVCGFLG
jgi:hypothetical protein